MYLIYKPFAFIHVQATLALGVNPQIFSLATLEQFTTHIIQAIIWRAVTTAEGSNTVHQILVT
jgi:hypothetical protein